MKKLLLLLPLIIILYACNSGGAGSSNAKLTTLEDSMYYAFGLSIVQGSGVEGIDWDASSFEKGLSEAASGEATLDPNAALQQIQQFGGEIQGRQGREVTSEDPISANMEEVSYAYGIFLHKQLQDIELEVRPEMLVAGMADGASGNARIQEEAKMQQLSAQFNQMAQAKGREVQERKTAAEAGPNKEAGAAFMEENKTKEGVKTHESGMQYKVLKSGDQGGESPTVADKVTIHYEGRLLDGTVFDSSYKRGEPATFPLSNLIKGWQIALPMMKPGDKWTIWLPSDIAYGNAGSPPNIPAGATLEFDIEYFGIGE